MLLLIEQQMLDPPAITQVAVVGAPDERMGEVGAAFVFDEALHLVDEVDGGLVVNVGVEHEECLVLALVVFGQARHKNLGLAPQANLVAVKKRLGIESVPVSLQGASSVML